MLNALGAIAAGPNLQLLQAWQACEGGSASFNPLNTTQPEPGATNYNSIGVKNYPDAATGLRATVTTLTNGFYSGIVADIRTGGFSAAAIVQRNAGEFSTWGTSTICLSRETGLLVPPPGTPPSPPGKRHAGGVPYTLPPNQTPIPEKAPEPLSVFRAWKQLVHALGVTRPTQAHRVERASRNFMRAIR